VEDNAGVVERNIDLSLFMLFTVLIQVVVIIMNIGGKEKRNQSCDAIG
jgi:hypothetical protein